MSMPEVFALIVLLFAVASLPYFINRGPKRVRFAKLSAEQRAQLGDALAGVLTTTRTLRSDIDVFEQHARRMLAEELACRLPSGHRPYGRQLDDANFLDDVRKLRRAGQAWYEQLAAIPEADRRRFDIEIDALTGLFELAWPCDEGVSDRSGELQQLLAQARAAGDALAQIDGALCAPPESPYR